MLVKLNRFMTSTELKRYYRIPDALFQKIHSHLPVATYADDGTPYYLESHLDRFFDQWLDPPGPSEADPEAASAITTGQALPAKMIPPDQVEIDGGVYGPLTPSQWKLLEIVLKSGSVGIHEAVRHVYGGRFAGKEEGLRQHRKRINTLLASKGCRKMIDISNGELVLR